jgi:hypothetical protein
MSHDTAADIQHAFFHERRAMNVPFVSTGHGKKWEFITISPSCFRTGLAVW